ncbi:hypothetical protein [Streptomyces violascens]|uniref:hypothetical protein n=1 Tax=Streptomyces violascens TaxID=67381 RepID=UPI00365F235F
MHTTGTGLPAAGGCELHDAGIDWDAIRVPRMLGLTALDILGPRSGAVMDDGHALYWFLPLGTVDGWQVESTRPLTAGGSLTVPPARRTQGPGPYWRICPGDTNWHTEPAALRAAVEDALEARVRNTP